MALIEIPTLGPAKVEFRLAIAGERHTCPFCGGYGYLKLDKKGRPFFTCEMCWTRLFIKTQRALEGFGEISEARSSQNAMMATP